MELIKNDIIKHDIIKHDIIKHDISLNKTNQTFETERQIEKAKKSDNCQELKNIAYKTMLLNGTDINPKREPDSDTKNVKISEYLESESNNSKSEIWTKLDKTQKIMRLNIYADTLITKHGLNETEVVALKRYFIRCLDRKNLTKTKEVIYNKDTNLVETIPYLIFNPETRVFILKRDDKHVSTVKSLPLDKKAKVKAKTLKIGDKPLI